MRRRVSRKRKLRIDRQKLIIILVGLPGRGKTFLCNKLMCYLNWRAPSPASVHRSGTFAPRQRLAYYARTVCLRAGLCLSKEYGLLRYACSSSAHRTECPRSGSKAFTG